MGGRSLRKRSSLLINDDLLVDLGPDIMASAQQHQVTLTQVCYCLQTHPHADHLDLSHLLSRSPAFGVVGAPRLHFYASRQTLERAAQTFIRDLASEPLLEPATQESLNLSIQVLEPYQPVLFGSYRVTGLPANHAHGMEALMYAVEENRQAILYATDSAAFLEPTWQALHKMGIRLDLAILDHTYGPEQPGGDHLSARQVIEHAARLREEGLFTPQGRVIATHIAHEGNPPHPELVDYAAQNGYDIAYDGLVLNIG